MSLDTLAPTTARALAERFHTSTTRNQYGASYIYVSIIVSIKKEHSMSCGLWFSFDWLSSSQSNKSKHLAEPKTDEYYDLQFRHQKITLSICAK